MIKSCAECPQYVVKEIEPEFPAFCLYWGEGLLADTSTCRPLKEGQVPKERVTTLTDLAAASPYGLAGLEYSQSLEVVKARQEGKDRSHGDLPEEGQHLVKITKVLGYLYNFGEYSGPRARLRMEILEGPDVGKPIFDNISLPHANESKGMLERRARIAYRLGLVPWGANGIVQINWKSLEGVSCWVDVAHKKYNGRVFANVTGYSLQQIQSP
jgi:hypothetical protein